MPSIALYYMVTIHQMINKGVSFVPRRSPLTCVGFKAAVSDDLCSTLTGLRPLTSVKLSKWQRWNQRTLLLVLGSLAPCSKQLHQPVIKYLWMPSLVQTNDQSSSSLTSTGQFFQSCLPLTVLRSALIVASEQAPNSTSDAARICLPWTRKVHHDTRLLVIEAQPLLPFNNLLITDFRSVAIAFTMHPVSEDYRDQWKCQCWRALCPASVHITGQNKDNRLTMRMIGWCIMQVNSTLIALICFSHHSVAAQVTCRSRMD